MIMTVHLSIRQEVVEDRGTYSATAQGMAESDTI